MASRPYSYKADKIQKIFFLHSYQDVEPISEVDRSVNGTPSMGTHGAWLPLLGLRAEQAGA